VCELAHCRSAGWRCIDDGRLACAWAVMMMQLSATSLMLWLHALLALTATCAALNVRKSPIMSWGPPHLQGICEDGICHRYGKLLAPLDHDDASQGEWELVYFVNSNYWDPVAKPNAPIFINMGYGATDVPGYTAGALRRVDEASFARGFPGATPAFAEELGALIINVPNRYYGCNTARAGNPEGTCPTSLGEIPDGDEGIIEAHHRLRFLSLKAVVDDIAHVARETVSTFATDWGMTLVPGEERAPNQPIIFGCSWPGAAAVYGRMLHPDVFPGAVATSHPLSSSPEGNNFYRSFLGAVYELYSAGGSLECRNAVQVSGHPVAASVARSVQLVKPLFTCLFATQVGHEEIKRRLETNGVEIEPVGSCVPSGSGSCCIRNCVIAADVNSDFGLGPEEWHTFGIGVPGLPRECFCQITHACAECSRRRFAKRIFATQCRCPNDRPRLRLVRLRHQVNLRLRGGLLP
jgi:hypothetical protein